MNEKPHPELHAELESIYRDLAAEITAANPICRQSGDCCNFVKTDHVLFVTQLEIDYLLRTHALPDESRVDGCCPFLTAEKKCGVRDHRMLGCRIYYCDSNYTATGQDLYEKYLRRIKDLYRKHNISWRYFAALPHFRKRQEKRSDPEP